MGLGMRKADSLAQLEQGEAAFSENPELSRGISPMASARAGGYLAAAGRDPGIRSAGGVPGSTLRHDRCLLVRLSEQAAAGPRRNNCHARSAARSAPRPRAGG